MIRPDLLLLGYRVFTVKKEDVALAAQVLLVGGISVKFKGASFVAGAKKSRKIESLLATRVEFSKSELMGLSGFVLRHRKRWGVISALAITLFIFLFSQNRIWDVRVDGCSEENKEKIIEELGSCGFEVGARWSSCELSEVEVDFLKSTDIASWVNINRRGTVAYVTVIEKVTHQAPEVKAGYSNVVASHDAVIAEITVTSGVAAVKVGDSVKKGDLLISGIITNELGTEFCYAEGVVIGRISDTLSYTATDSVAEISEKEKLLTKIKLNIFDFSLNIFNKTGNCGDECDIIDVVDKISIFGARLPFAVYKQYAVTYESRERQLDKSEMIRSASEGMSLALEEKLGEATLVRIRTEGNFSDDAYTLNSSIVYLQEIGSDRAFSVEQK